MTTAAIVGLEGALRYLQPLRDLGVDVTALAAPRDVDAASRMARRWGVPLGTGSLSDLTDVDLVVVSAPMRTGLEVIRALPTGPFLVCDGPVLGPGRGGQAVADRAGEMLVNHPFCYLETAHVAEEALLELGKNLTVSLRSRVSHLRHVDPAGTARERTVEAFLESASDPAAWLLRLLGQPTVRSRTVSDESLVLGADCADGAQLEVTMTLGGPLGVHHEIRLAGPESVVTLRGVRIPPGGWRYDPVTRDGVRLNAGESASTDPWLDAHRRAVADAVAVVEGRQARRDVVSEGLYDLRTAGWVESLLSQTVAADSAP